MKFAITGSRNFNDYNQVKQALEQHIFSRDDVDEIIFGGARGVDTVALRCASELKKQLNKAVTLTVIVPFRIDDQPKEAIKAIQECADKVVELGLPRSKFGFLKRNKKMVESADRVLAFWDGKDGGTGNTIDLAKKLKKEVTIVRIATQSLNSRDNEIEGGQ
jgi:uncharacterized phage-like protein YoqJ